MLLALPQLKLSRNNVTKITSLVLWKPREVWCELYIMVYTCAFDSVLKAWRKSLHRQICKQMISKKIVVISRENFLIV